MSTDLRHRLGRQGEDLAAAHLERLGFQLLARNHRTRFGELDLVAYDGRVIVFAEVKTRRAGSGHPWDALDELKRRQVRRMAAAWLHDAPDRPASADLRFDAIGVVIDAHGRLVRLDHLEAAF
jgi:putative endonuclease